jgi:hypothetical protein
MTYACPAWEFAAETYLLKLQRLQNKVLRTIGSFRRHTSVCDMHMAFQIPYVYDNITKSCKQKSYKIMKTKMFAILDKSKPDTGNTKGFNLAAVMFTTVQVFMLALWRELHSNVQPQDTEPEHPSCNSTVSSPSDQRLLQLFDANDFEISAPQCPNLYPPVRNEDVLDIMMHKNIRLSNVIVSDILDSDHLPIVFHILDHVRTKHIIEPLENLQIESSFKA